MGLVADHKEHDDQGDEDDAADDEEQRRTDEAIFLSQQQRADQMVHSKTSFLATATGGTGTTPFLLTDRGASQLTGAPTRVRGLDECSTPSGAAMQAFDW